MGRGDGPKFDHPESSRRRRVVFGGFQPRRQDAGLGGGGNKIKLWNVAAGKSTTILDRDRVGLPMVVFSPDGKTLASGGRCLTELDESIKSNDPLLCWDCGCALL